jgi:hypothetical protein
MLLRVVTLAIGVLLFLIVQMPANGQTLTARDYYNELHDAGGLDSFADQYVCFDNDLNNDSFFIFARSSILRDFLKGNGGWNQLTKDQQALLSNNWLILRNYTKGVATAAGRRYLNEVGDSWIEEPYKIPSGGSMRFRFAMNWQTLRYSAGVDSRTSAGGAYLPVKEHYGRCEKVKP